MLLAASFPLACGEIACIYSFIKFLINLTINSTDPFYSQISDKYPHFRKTVFALIKWKIENNYSF